MERNAYFAPRTLQLGKVASGSSIDFVILLLKFMNITFPYLHMAHKRVDDDVGGPNGVNGYLY